MLRRMLRVWGGGGQNPPDDRMGDPISVHSNCCGLGCRERESAEDVVGKAANKHTAVDFPNHSLHYYDSMGSSGTGYLLATLRYLRDNHMIRHGTPLPGNWQIFSPGRAIPQQENGTDCGVFVCSFADNTLQGLPITTTQPTAMGMYRYWIAHAIIRGVLPPTTPHT